jgi:putative redox protein
MAHTEAVWQGDMSFELELQGFKQVVDADASVGGKNKGPTPNKMQMPFDRFEIKIDGETTDSHPKVFGKIDLVYQFWGSELDEKKIEKACQLSQTKYCGVSATLQEVGEVNWRVELNP